MIDGADKLLMEHRDSQVDWAAKRIAELEAENAALKLVEGQKPPTNSAMDAISALRDLVGMIDGFLKWTADAHLSESGQSKLDRAKDVLKLHQ